MVKGVFLGVLVIHLKMDGSVMYTAGCDNYDMIYAIYNFLIL